MSDFNYGSYPLPLPDLETGSAARDFFRRISEGKRKRRRNLESRRRRGVEDGDCEDGGLRGRLRGVREHAAGGAAEASLHHEGARREVPIAESSILASPTSGNQQAMINQARDQTKFFLGFHSHCLKKANHEDDEAALEKARKEIEANQENALSLCTEKVLLARQAYDLIDGHVKRLDEDLKQFAEDLKQEGKIPVDEPATLPPLPITVKDEKRKSGFLTSQSKRPDFREKDWDRERDRDLELMPPPGSHKKNVLTSMDVDQPDPNEPTYCVCHQVSFGDMIACDNENCEGGEWFHYSCVGLTPETRFKGKWFCPTCTELM